MAVKYAANVGLESISINGEDLTAAFGAGSEFALTIPNHGTPSVAWQTIFSAAPDSITVLLQASLDGINWFTIDTSTSVTGEIRSVSGSYKFLRINNSAVANGAGKTLTGSFVYSNSITTQTGEQEISGVITTAEMNNLFSAPIVVIPDSAALNQWIFPTRVTWRKEAGTLYTMNGSAGMQLYGGAPQSSILMRISSTGNLDINDETRGCQFNLPSSTTQAVFAGFNSGFAGTTFAKGLQWGCPTANFSGGVGNFFYNIKYFSQQDPI